MSECELRAPFRPSPHLPQMGAVRESGEIPASMRCEPGVKRGSVARLYTLQRVQSKAPSAPAGPPHG